MNQAGTRSMLRRCALLGFALTATGVGALLAGCRGNTTAAATVDHHAGTPPEILIQQTTGDLTGLNPLTSEIWHGATWHDLQAPSNSTRMPPPSRAAILFDASKLYIAVICEAPASPERQDAVSVYLDTAGQGREVMQITTDSDGHTRCTWIRAGAAPAPLPDGAPNLSTPLDVRPDFSLPGMVARVTRNMEAERPVWSVALALPVAALPPVMQAPLGQGEWRCNILRTLTVESDGQHEQLQSNLSPVYLNAQAFSPYRLAHFKFAGQDEGTVSNAN